MYTNPHIRYVFWGFLNLLSVSQLYGKSERNFKIKVNKCQPKSTGQNYTLVKIMIIIKFIVAAVIVVNIFACFLKNECPPPPP